MAELNWRFGIAANIVKQHTDADGNTWYGTKEFVGGAKVYVDGKNYFNYDRKEIVVIGLSRGHKYQFASLNPNMLENVRFQIIRNKIVLEMLDHEADIEGWNWYGRTAEDKRHAKEFVANWEQHVKDMTVRNKTNE